MSLFALNMKCTLCGASMATGCNCWVRLRCPKCGDAKSVPRDKTDPPDTAAVHTLCPECCGGDFSEVTYYRRDGTQILEF